MQEPGHEHDTIVPMTSPEAVSYFFAGTQVRLGEASLREAPEDPSAVKAWCAENPEDPATVVGLRLLGRLDEAESLGRSLLGDPSLTPLQRAVRRTRLAHVLHVQGCYAEAEEEYATAAEETGFEDPVAAGPLLVLATVLQHRATSRYEQAEREASAASADPSRVRDLRDAAEEDARRALAIGTSCGASADQLASSQQVLNRIASRR